MIYVFGDYTLDIRVHELRHDGNVIKLEPQVFKVLVYLVQHHDRVVSKKELHSHLWPDQFVSDAALARCLRAARLAIADSGRMQRMIKTLHRQGYRFVAPVEERGTVQNPAPLETLAKHNRTGGSLATGERKPVTVLSCALVHAAMLSDHLSSDTCLRFAYQFFKLARRVVQRYEGTLESFTEDGFVALFGVPVAHEDHARRALLAARDLRRHLSERVATFTALPGKEVALRFGMHTGRVVGVRIGEDRPITYLAVGDTLRLATHLQLSAELNTMVISDATARLVQDAVRLEAYQVPQFPGQPIPVTAYKVLRAPLQRTPWSRRRHRPLRQFVGRERELALLQELLDRAMSGQGQVVGIVGEPGIGKSRLLAEFHRRLQGTRLTYVEGRCLPYGSGIPYLPVRDILCATCGVTPADRPETVVVKIRRGLTSLGLAPDTDAPYLLHLLGIQVGTEALVGRSPEAIKMRTFAILRQMCLNGSQRQPLLLVVEDLHWSDRMSQELFAWLIDSLSGTPLCLLVTYRAGYQPPWQEAKSYITQLSLQSLSSQDGMSIVRAVRGTTPLPDTVMHEILAKADGNPFFLEELTRAVVDRDDFQAPVSVPDTIQGVLQARLDRLPEAPKQLLQIAAVLGRGCTEGLLEAIWESPEDLEPLLQELQRREFLHAQPGTLEPTYAFKHALTQEVVYARLSSSRRQLLHAAAGRTLERLYGERLEEIYDRLAYHYARTEDAARAVEYLIRFADQATRGQAHMEAAAALQEALQYTEHLPSILREPCRVDVTLRLAQSLSYLGHFSNSLDLLLAQRGRLEHLHKPSLAGPYYFRLGRTYSLLGDQRQAAQYTRKALDAATRCGDRAILGRAHYELARELFLSGPPRQGLIHGQQAIALLDHPEERWWLGLTYWIVGALHTVLGSFATALEATAQAQAIGQAIDDLHVQSYAAFTTGWIEATRGEWAAGVAACRQSLEWARDPVSVAHAEGALGSALLEQGEAAEAALLLERAVQQWQRFSLRSMQGWMMTFLATAYLVQGQLEQAYEIARQGLATTTDTRFQFAIGCAQRVLGRVDQAQGKLAEAQTHLSEALNTFRTIEARFELGRTHLDLAALAHAQGAPKIVATHLTHAHTVFRTLQVPQYVTRAMQLANAFGIPCPVGKHCQRSSKNH